MQSTPKTLLKVYVPIFIFSEKWILQVSQRTPTSVKKILVANKIDCNEE